MKQPIVIKVGGHEIEDSGFLRGLAQAILSMEQPVVVVHGGGREISELQVRLGINPVYVDGVRVTDAASLDVVTMMLCGLVNKRVVRLFGECGMDAIGLSGIDRAMITATPMRREQVDMGFTGEVGAVRAEILQGYIRDGVVPVIAPICCGQGSALNVNADHVAGAVASALHAQQLVFLTNVRGVMNEQQVIPRMTARDVQQLIESGVITGGMIPKVQTALHALSMGVTSTMITNLDGLSSASGTVFVKESGAS
jgi:acetylglutamate kinase